MCAFVIEQFPQHKAPPQAGTSKFDEFVNVDTIDKFIGFDAGRFEPLRNSFGILYLEVRRFGAEPETS